MVNIITLGDILLAIDMAADAGLSVCSGEVYQVGIVVTHPKNDQKKTQTSVIKHNAQDGFCLLTEEELSSTKARDQMAMVSFILKTPNETLTQEIILVIVVGPDNAVCKQARKQVITKIEEALQRGDNWL